MKELLCGIVLAGGKGKRLQPFVRSWGRSMLPKQYVNFIGARSMLEQTLQRGEKLIPSAHLLTVIAESHLRYPEVREQFATRPNDTVLVQPENKDTGPGLISPLVQTKRIASGNSFVRELLPFDRNFQGRQVAVHK